MSESYEESEIAVTELTVEELLDAGGTEVGPSDWMRITQDRIDLFADATDDHQWIHVGPERAKDGPFGKTVAHGYLTLSLVPVMLQSVLELKDVKMGVNYGIEKLRFTAPVPVDSEVRVKGRVTTARRKGDAVQYNVAVEVEVKNGERPALVGEVVYLVYA